MSHIKNKKLSGQGKLRIEWAEREMPVLRPHFGLPGAYGETLEW